MANSIVPISQLPAASVLTLNDAVAAVNNGITKKETLTQIMTLLGHNIQLDSAAQVTGLYATGTFTPAFSASVTPFGSVTYTTQVGTYTKLQNVVTFNLSLKVSALTVGSAAGNLIITGLPFAPGGGGLTIWSFSTFYQHLDAGTTNTQITTVVPTGATSMQVFGMNTNNSVGANVLYTGLESNTEYTVSGSYVV